MRTLLVKSLLIGLLALGLFHCDRGPAGSQPGGQGPVFMANEIGIRDDLLRAVARESDVLEGGYILIVPVGIEPSDERVLYLRKKVLQTLPNAVHVLEVEERQELLPSSRIMVEGASVIFLVGNRLNRFMKREDAEQLTDAIRKALDAGAAVVGLNQAVALLGDRRIAAVKDETGPDEEGGESPLRIHDALHLVPGIMVECELSDEPGMDQDDLRHLVDSLGSGYIGIPSGGIAVIRGGELFNLAEVPVMIGLMDGNPKWQSLAAGRKLPLKH